MIPDELVRIQVWRIARKKVQLNLPLFLLNKLHYHLSDVSRMTINHQEHRPPARTKKHLEELYKTSRVEIAQERLVPEASPSIDCRDGIDGLALTTGLNHRCLSPRSPSPTQGYVGANSSFIQEKNVRPPVLGATPQLRVVDLQPVLDRLRISLVSATQRLLRGNIQFGQQATHARHAEPHTEFLVDQVSHRFSSPQTEVESILSWVLTADPVSNRLFLLSGQLTRRPWSLPGAQCFFASLATLAKPAVDDGSTEAIALDDCARFLPLLDPPDSHPADRLQGLV